jgi:hypothetical protein
VKAEAEDVNHVSISGVISVVVVEFRDGAPMPMKEVWGKSLEDMVPSIDIEHLLETASREQVEAALRNARCFNERFIRNVLREYDARHGK